MQFRTWEDSQPMKTISILTPCFNEETNVEELYNQVRAVMAGLGRYHYEHLFIDTLRPTARWRCCGELAAPTTPAYG